MIFLIAAALFLFAGNLPIGTLLVAVAMAFGNSSYLFGLAGISTAWIYICVLTGHGIRAMSRYPYFIAAVIFGMFWITGFLLAGAILGAIALVLGLTKVY